MRLRVQKAVLRDRVAGPCDLVIRGGRIARVEPPRGRADESIRGLALPGLVDLQVNGAFGVDFAKAGVDDLRRASASLHAAGVTTFLPTILTGSPPAMRAAAARWARAGAPHGIHVEGPFLNPASRGVHPLEQVRLPDVAEFRGWGRVAMLTLAPELGGATRLIRAARRSLVSIGHSSPSREAYERGVAAGARFVTHVYNAMSGLHHRDGGLVAFALADDRVSCGLIYDRRHVSRDAARIAVRAKGVDRVCLTSDLLAADSPLRDGVLAGSTASLWDQLWFAAEDLGVGLPSVVRMAAANPARLLGLRKGALAPGHDADVTVASGRRVVAVWRGGERIA